MKKENFYKISNDINGEPCYYIHKENMTDKAIANAKNCDGRFYDGFIAGVSNGNNTGKGFIFTSVYNVNELIKALN